MQYSQVVVRHGMKDVLGRFTTPKHSLTLSNLLLIDECLLDVRRVKIFKAAIERTVKPGHVVLDAGTGTGIMALCAARAGAKKVFAIELDPDIAEVARHNVHANHYDDVIEIVNQDVAMFNIKNRAPIDVLIMEMLDTGLIAEHQATTMAALRRNCVINDHTRLLPAKVDLLMRVIDYDFDFYGFDMSSIIQARNYGAKKRIKRTFSHLQSYGIIDFMSVISNRLETSVSLKMNRTGRINGVELRMDIYLDDKKYSHTTDMNMPVIVPIRERMVKRGSVVDLKISYNMGEGFGTLKIV